MKLNAVAKFMTIAVVSCGLYSCGGKSEGNKTEGDSAADTTLEVEEVLEDSEEQKAEETIFGFMPGVEYGYNLDGFMVNLTFYKDGTTSSNWSGEGSWTIQSKHDQDFLVVYLPDVNYGEHLYIDADHKVHISSPSSKGYQLELINSLPQGAKRMVVGKKYTMPEYKWGKDGYITLNQDGTITSDFEGNPMPENKWKHINLEGNQWVMVYVEKPSGDVLGYIISPNLEYYSFNSAFNDDIIYNNGNIELGERWKNKRVGRLKE